MTSVRTPPPTTTPVDTEPSGEQPKERFFTLGRTVGTVIVALLAVMWLYLFIFGNDYHGAGWLTDRTFPPKAEKICNRTEDYISRLPAASQSTSATARADTIDLANDRLRQMQGDLRAEVPAISQAKYINEWLDDWTTFIHDRQSYADHLRQNPKAEFLVTPKDGTQLSESLDNFADVNNMMGCETPHDV
jgi:hypothetical protein